MKKNIVRFAIVFCLSFIAFGCANKNQHLQLNPPDRIVSDTQSAAQPNDAMINAINTMSANIAIMSKVIEKNCTVKEPAKAPVNSGPKRVSADEYSKTVNSGTTLVKKKASVKKITRSTYERKFSKLERQHASLKKELADLTYRVDYQHDTAVTGTKLTSDSSCLPEPAKAYLVDQFDREKAGEIKILGIRIITGRIQSEIGITNEQLGRNRHVAVSQFLKSIGIDPKDIVFDPIVSSKPNSAGAEIRVIFQVIKVVTQANPI